MDSASSPDYKALYLRAEEERRWAEESQKKAEENQRRAEEERDQGRERTRPTTFLELLRLCHTFFSLQLRAESPSRSTTGKIPPPTGKYCPLRLRHWEDCAARQQEIYRSVCAYLAPPDETAAQLFSPRLVLEDLGQKFGERAINSEQDLESYERFDRFGLGDGVKFDNHANALDQTETEPSLPTEPSTYRRFRPDQFCIRRVDGERNTLLTTVEYKPPHKLSVENLRAGLREMNFWEEVYHVMIQEGLEYSYLTNGLALVLLRVPYDEPGTLYYHLCEPNMEIDLNDDQSFDQPLTAIARVLCLCLLSFGAPVLPERELRQNPPSSEYSPSVSSGRTVSEYLLSSSPVESPTQRRRIPTRSRAQCAPNTMEREDSPDLDTDSAPGGRKCGFSQTGTRPNERGGTLDDCCPNVELHRQGGTSNQHLIDASGLVRRIKQQLDQNLDVDCTPMGGCGASGAPFKITCTAYGYTVVGKGTTSYLWNEIKREADIYRILWRVQGRAVPVFLGTIDLAMIYFLHGAGQIHVEAIRYEISWSQKKIRSLGVIHQDLRSDNMLWNAELGRVLIIDFHRSQLDSRPMKKRMKLREQHSCRAEEHGRKRVRIGQ
ncbi:hypothetical protein BDV41DRAFT_583967 [Aspergillus transmontanensis]|uniref:Protein kinase domain-containing protein n=1 Tax=Aspergillus transmontanensis TaxID=1034304 RepID=A0A5N6VHF0_9EURO|nr:hypothetical protein BDV41DRAFT_583967 [Aspergillus transmontanensis]